MNQDAALVRRLAVRQGEAFAAALAARFGWPGLRLSADVDGGRRRVLLRGDAITRRLVQQFTDHLRPLLPPSYELVSSIVTAEERAPWVALRVPVARVWRERGLASLSTELLRADGPVQILTVTRDAALIRAVDGTVGWIADTRAQKPSNPETQQPTSISWRDAARSFLGVPYRAGGTTPDGVDCSGLVQRLYRSVDGAVIPRHSRDQFSVAPLRHGERREGQLAFLDGRGESPFHVGIVIRRGRGDWSVVHASSSRGRVVEDSYEEYFDRGREVRIETE